MPYINKLDDEDQQLQEGSEQISAGSQVLGAGNPNAKPAGASAKKGSGQFADLTEYLRVNQPQEFGGQLAGKVGEDVAQSDQAVQQAGDEFKRRADASTVEGNDALVSEATGENAADFVQDDGKVKEFQRELNARYTGPTAFSDAADLHAQSSGAAQTAAGKAKAASTEGGRFALLDNYFGRENYNRGQKALDNLLVQNDQNAQQAFNQIQDNAKAVTEHQKSVEDQSNAHGAQARGKTEKAAADARGALGVDEAGNILDTSPIEQIRRNAENRATQFNTDKAAQDAGIRQGLGSLALTDAQFAQLGLTPGQTFGVNPLSFLNPVQGDATADSAATKAEQRRLAALAKLASAENTYLPYEDLAGTFDPLKDVNFRTADYQKAVAEAKARIEPLVAERDRLTGIANAASSLANPSGDDEFLMNTWNVGAGEMVQPLLQAEGIDFRTARDRYASPLDFARAMQAKYSASLSKVAGQIPGNYQAALRRA